MRLEAFKYFMAIARGSKFMDASLDFNITQSTLSKSIIRLEQELGVNLFIRNRNPITLSAAGKQLYEDIIDIEPKIKMIAKHLQIFRQNRYITCNVITSVNIIKIEKIFDYWSKEHSDIYLYCSDVPDAWKVIDALQNGDIDFALMHVNYLLPGDLYPKILMKKDRICVILPENHSLGYNSEVSLADLINETLLLTELSSILLSSLCKETYERLHINFSELHITKFDKAEILLNKIRVGKGISIFFESDLEYFNLSKLKNYILKEAFDRDLALVWKRDIKFTSDQQIFCDFVVKAFSHKLKG
jgi:DNA-binding transcriptional LysR family regulator